MKIFEYGGNFFEKIEESNLYLDNKEDCLFFDSGRSALNFLVNFMCNKCKKILLPAYTCDTVIMPFFKGNCELFFYPVDKKFEITAEKLKKIVEECNPDMILIHSYFGFNTIKNLYSVLYDFMKHGIYVIEDITHNLLSYDNTFIPDFRVGSLRKWCGILDGGFLNLKSSRVKKIKFEMVSDRQNEKFIQLRAKAKNMKWEYMSGMTKDHNFIFFFEKSEEILNEQNEIFTMSDITRKSILKIKWDEIKKKRIENFVFIKQKLQNMINITIPKLNFDENTIPFFFPVFINADIRDLLRKNLREKGILLPVIWPKPKYWDFRESILEIYNEILAIPCDQRYHNSDIEFMIQELIYELKKFKLDSDKEEEVNMYLSKAREDEFEEYYIMKCEDFNLYWTARDYKKPPRENLKNFYMRCIKADLLNPVRKEIYFIRTDDNEYAGYLYLDIKGDILDIPVAVKKDFTRRGLAKKAIMQGLEMAKKMGIKKTIVKIREDNLSSIRLYTACGYTVTDDFTEIYFSELKKKIKMYTVYKNLD